MILKKSGYKNLIHFANNGKEGLEIIDDDPLINVVFLDINMPIMDGFEYLCALSKKDIVQPYVFVMQTVELSEERKEQINEFAKIIALWKENL